MVLFYLIEKPVRFYILRNSTCNRTGRIPSRTHQQPSNYLQILPFAYENKDHTAGKPISRRVKQRTESRCQYIGQSNSRLGSSDIFQYCLSKQQGGKHFGGAQPTQGNIPIFHLNQQEKSQLHFIRASKTRSLKKKTETLNTYPKFLAMLNPYAPNEGSSAASDTIPLRHALTLKSPRSQSRISHNNEFFPPCR